VNPKNSIFELARALGGIPVLGALAGSAAEKAGIRYGDVILSVNGHKTPTIVEYVEAKALRRNGMEVVVFRSGEERVERLEYVESDEEGASPPDVAAILSELIAGRILPSSSPEGGGDGEVS
jgi:S1-C subfamily serine protease